MSSPSGCTVGRSTRSCWNAACGWPATCRARLRRRFLRRSGSTSPRCCAPPLIPTPPAAILIEGWGEAFMAVGNMRRVIAAGATASRLGCPDDLSWPAIVVDGNEGEDGVGHLDAVALTLAEGPDFDRERDRGTPRAQRLRIAADDVADLHRLAKHDAVDGDRDDPAV